MVLLIIITLGLGFDFINGFHDTANSIATTVATRALTPLQAVLMAAVFNVIGALSGTAVATTIAEGIVSLQYATQELIIASLISAIIWNLITWWLAIPIKLQSCAGLFHGWRWTGHRRHSGNRNRRGR